jgi:isoleucyl-tRNA synthetase
VVTRFACATGHHCTRRFGWDCHGLPVEFEIDKQLGAPPCALARSREPAARGHAQTGRDGCVSALLSRARRHQEQG